MCVCVYVCVCVCLGSECLSFPVTEPPLRFRTGY